MSTYEHLHAEVTQHYALAHHHLLKMKMVLDEMATVKKVSGNVQSPVRCVREWTDWLAANGPNLKGVITEATMTKFTERGAKYTVDWSPMLSDVDDDHFAQNTLMKISGKPKGRGAPPKIYFLWSQRWDVHPLFGVGPIKPESKTDLTGLTHDEAMEVVHGPHPQAVDTSGLLYVPEEVDFPLSTDSTLDAEIAEALSQPTRFATIDEWDAYHAPLFDALVSADAKPSDEQKQTLRDTLPEGAEPNAALAIAYREATLRARQPAPMTGVVQPPDLSGVEVVGSHNHVPHIYGPLCQVSDCRPA